MYVCMCVYECMCMCVCMYVCVCMNVCMCFCVGVCVFLERERERVVGISRIGEKIMSC